VVEMTSGNTGIGLAMVCAAKGYPLVIVMPESFSIERRKLMRFLGAKVLLTPAPLRATGAITKTIELAKKHGWFMTRQFENPANIDAHVHTTAQEILADFPTGIDALITGVGPRTGAALDHKNVTNRVWHPLLRHLGLAPRRPYQCRHTAATLWLASGESPQWIAAQLGHTTTEMLFRVYARYVPNLTRRDGSAFERLITGVMGSGERQLHLPEAANEAAVAQKEVQHG